MAKLISLRQICPALCDLNAFSCTTRLQKGCRLFSNTRWLLESENEDYKINKEFINRNPCTLEFQGIAPKRKGWKFQSPRKDYYYKLHLDIHSSKLTGRIEHWTGTTVIQAHTKEKSIRKHLYSAVDVSAAANLGTILARRCLEAGITQVFYDKQPQDSKSEKIQAFMKSVQEGNLDLTEPDEIKHEIEPGLHYDKRNRLGEKKQYQDDYQIV